VINNVSIDIVANVVEKHLVDFEGFISEIMNAKNIVLMEIKQ